MLIVIAQESGSGFVDDSANWRRNLKGRKAERKLHLFDAILGLHLRACRVASEVFCLLKSGFADGAMARWRTLHELAIVIMFLWQHKGDCGTRYLSHAFIERFKAARQYQCHCGRLGHEPHSPSEMHEFRADYDSVVAKYGTDFATEYGWAAKAIGIKCPTFADIEKSIDLAHWRPYFKMACHSVHAGPQALGFSLGSPTGQPYAGASNAGLADPGHSTAISLTLATSSFLTLRTNLDGLVACQIMRRLTDDIGREFLKANKAMEEKILAEAAEG
jgi:hypothetical protein